MTSPDRSAALASEIDRLDALLRPADQRQLADRLRVLFAALPSQDREGAEDLRVRAYLLALDGMPIAVVDEVLSDVLRGRIADVSPVFAPTPPQLARLCKQRLDALCMRRQQARQQQTNDMLARLNHHREPLPEDPARKAAALQRAAEVSSLLGRIVDRWDAASKPKRMRGEEVERAIRIMETFEETDR